MNYAALVIPVVFLVSGYVLGRLIEGWVVRRLKAASRRSESKLDDVIVDSLGNITTIWFVLLGAYFAIASGAVPQDLGWFLNALLTVGFIASGTLFAARVAVGYLNAYAGEVSAALPSTTILGNVTRLLVIGIGVLITLQTLGISVTPILTALGVGGLAVALAMQDTLSNLFAGLQIIGSGQVRPGDFIKLDNGEQGFVVDVAWRNTTVRELSNNMIIVPNAKLASSQVRNFDQPGKELAVLIEVGVSYDSDLQKVERVTIEVGKEVMESVAGGVPGFQPFIRYHSFSDFSIDFTVILRGRAFVDQYLIKHEFIKRLHRRYRVESIEIPFPVRTLRLEEPEELVRLISGASVNGHPGAHE